MKDQQFTLRSLIHGSLSSPHRHFIAPLPPLPDLLPLPGLVQERSRETIKAARTCTDAKVLPCGEMTSMAYAVASREKTFAVEKAAGHSKQKTDEEEHVLDSHMTKYYKRQNGPYDYLQ